MGRKIIFTVTNDLVTDQRMQRICASLNGDNDILLVGRRLPHSKTAKFEGFKTHRLKCVFNSGKLFYLEYNLRVFIFLLFSKFDILSAVDLDTIIPNVLIGKIKRKPVLFDAHEYFEEVPEVVNRTTIKKVWQKIGRYFIPKVSKAYTVNQSLAQIFKDKYNIPFEVIENRPITKKINPNKSSFEVNQQLPIILYQGVLNEGRGLEIAIDAMKQIEGVLWLVGDGDIKQKLEVLTQEFNLENKVKFYGKIAPENLSEINKNATIGINLLENNGLSYYYSLANKFFDYIQAELPQISMAFPEYERYNSEIKVGLLIDELTIEKYVVAVQNLLVEETYMNIKTNIHVAKKEWVWQSQIEKLNNIYDIKL